MKRKLIITSFLVLAGFITAGLINNAMSHANGAPEGNTGSPSDKNTCATSCHQGTLTAEKGWIKSNTLPTGYFPGRIYSITLTTGGSYPAAKFGFQVSPQDANGNLMGTMMVTDANATKLIGNDKYMTHTKPSVSTTGSTSWSFNWTAPKKGSGKVTFYAAFMISGKKQNVYTSSLEIPEGKS